MENMSMNQALGVWSELEQAYFGANGFGGNTAEIYAYRLLPYNPRTLIVEGAQIGDEARQEQASMAGKNLYTLIKKFCADRGCSIEVNGASPKILLKQGLYHRCHVRVLKGK